MSLGHKISSSSQSFPSGSMAGTKMAGTRPVETTEYPSQQVDISLPEQFTMYSLP